MLSRWIRGYGNSQVPKGPGSGSGTGDVVGPGTSADNTLVRFNGTNNKTIQGSTVIIDDTGELYGDRLKLNTQTDDYTTQNSDSGKMVEINAATAKTLTLHATAPVGVFLNIAAVGAGQITVASTGSGVVRNVDTQFKSKAQYAVMNAYVRSNAGGSAAVWILSGSTAA